jgi:hypothetical protein
VLESEPFFGLLGWLVISAIPAAAAYHKRLESSNAGERRADYNLWLYWY